MLIESFLTKIVAAVFKKAILGTALSAIATAYEIYSTFDAISDLADCVDSVNDCNELAVRGLQVVSDYLTEAAVDQILCVGSDTFVVEKTSSGVYIASKLVPPFRTSQVSFPTVPTVRASHQPKVYTPPTPRVRKG